MNRWLILGMLLPASLLAQQVTNAPPAAPLSAGSAGTVTAPPSAATVTNVPAAKPTKKKQGKKAQPTAKKKDPATELKTVPLTQGPAVVDATHVNVRGQPKLKSEVLGRLEKGQTVTVLEEIVHNNSATDEPSAWAKILLPTNVHVYVSSAFVDSANKTVKPKKLNLRSGPGENYSIVGRLQQGDAIKEIGAKADWIEIEAPANAYAFVAAQYLKQEAPAVAPAAATVAAVTPTPAPVETPAATTPAATPTEPKPTPAAVAEAPVIAAPPTNAPPVATTPAETPAATPAAPAAATDTNAVAEVTTAPPEEPAEPPKRIVEREGIVRGTVSIQAPSQFALYSPDNGHLVDYLYTKSVLLDMRRYKGLRVVVTGEESLDERWGNTPVITLQKIQVVTE